jgi:hypothetical protein
MVLALPGCSPESFAITACSLEGRLAFRVHEIDGLLWDYQPRPNMVLVRETSGHPQRMWSARINDLEKSDERPSRELMLYGQHLPEWEVDIPAHQLRAGKEYLVYMTDTGHSGETQFVAGEPLPKC